MTHLRKNIFPTIVLFHMGSYCVPHNTVAELISFEYMTDSRLTPFDS